MGITDLAIFSLSFDGEKEERRPNGGDVGIEGNSGSDSKANGVGWYGHLLRRDDGHVLRKALEF